MVLDATTIHHSGSRKYAVQATMKSVAASTGTGRSRSRVFVDGAHWKALRWVTFRNVKDRAQVIRARTTE